MAQPIVEWVVKCVWQCAAAPVFAARALRELDRSCQIVLIDGADRYAIQSLRVHAADFIVDAVEKK